MVVEFVTNRSRCPVARRRRTASTAPGIGSPETCRTPSTSSRIAAMDAESIRREITFRVSRSSGPGGQHAQKSSTRVEAVFDVEGSEGLSDAERSRVLDRLGGVVRAIAQDERSQLRNRELAVLEAVATEGSFGRAAEKLGYTQSAVSQQIATLERIVGARLVERPGGPRPVTLTEAGRILLGHAESIVARLQAAQADLAALA